MIRFSRSDFLARKSSSIIFGTVSASDRIAPVHGVQPSDRIRHITIWGFSPGIIGGLCSVGISKSPRTSTSRGLAKYSGTIGISSTWIYCQTSNSVQLESGKTRIVSPLLMRALYKLHSSASSDRKSTRLNSSHQIISYAVFCLKKKNKTTIYRSLCRNPRREPLYTRIGNKPCQPDGVEMTPPSGYPPLRPPCRQHSQHLDPSHH